MSEKRRMSQIIEITQWLLRHRDDRDPPTVSTQYVETLLCLLQDGYALTDEERTAMSQYRSGELRPW